MTSSFVALTWKRFDCVVCVFVILLVGMPSIIDRVQSETGVQDYCQWESFNVTCPEGSVLVMDTAQYGRMRLGRCMDTDFYIGCAADVLPLLDGRCSGRPTCVIPLPDSTLHHHQPCPKDLMVYLEASYSCLPVSSPDSRPCSETGPVKVHQAEGYLSSYVSQTLGLGAYSCPWIITVKPGQRIKLWLLDFSLSARYKTSGLVAQPGGRGGSSSGGSGGSSGTVSRVGSGIGGGGSDQVDAEYCHMYASVTEENRPRKHPICADNARELLVYTSVTHSLTIEVVEQVITDHSVNFVIKYTAIGCADFPAPRNTWTERSGDRVTVRCNLTSQSWHLICKSTAWIGEILDCNKDSPVDEKIIDDSIFPTYGLVIAVVIGIFVGSFCGFLLLAVVLWCKRRTTGDSQQYDHDVELVVPSSDSQLNSHQHICKLHQAPASEYGYTHVWEVRNTQLPIGTLQGTPVLRGGSRLISCSVPVVDGGQGSPPYQQQSAVPQEDQFKLPNAPRRDHLYECPIFDERFLGGARPMQPRIHCLSHSPSHTTQGGGANVSVGGPICNHTGGDRNISIEGSPRGMASPNFAAMDRAKFQASSGRLVGSEDGRGGLGGYIPAEEGGEDDERYRPKYGAGGNDPFFLTSGEQDLINKLPKTENHYL